MSLDLLQPIVLRPSRLKLVGFLVFSLLVVTEGIFILKSPGQPAAAGWACVILFGAGALVMAVMMIPGASYLRIERDGFTICALYRARLVPWSTVRGFGVTRLIRRQVVGISLTPGSRVPAGIARLNASRLGYEGMLPDTYGMSASALAALMNEALTQAKSIGIKV